MGAKPRSVGRPSKNTLRVELRLNLDDKVIAGFVKQAEARGVSVQEHIMDLIKARMLDAPQRQEREQQEAQDSAAASVEQWM